jgi:hypothetical protein
MAERVNEINVDLVRVRVNAFLAGAPVGAANLLAAEAGVSAGTLSLWRSGKYAAMNGNDENVALKLLTALNQRRAITAALNGLYTVCWLVNRRTGLDLVRTRRKLNRIRTTEPDAHIVQLWRGRNLRDLYFLEVDHEAASGGLRSAEPDKGGSPPGAGERAEPEPEGSGSGAAADRSLLDPELH